MDELQFQILKSTIELELEASAAAIQDIGVKLEVLEGEVNENENSDS